MTGIPALQQSDGVDNPPGNQELHQICMRRKILLQPACLGHVGCGKPIRSRLLPAETALQHKPLFKRNADLRQRELTAAWAKFHFVALGLAGQGQAGLDMEKSSGK